MHNHVKIDLSKKIKIKPKRQTLGPETILNVCKMRKDTLEFGCISNRLLYSEFNVFFFPKNEDDMIKLNHLFNHELLKF